jgi:hypothetical protein
MIIIWLITDNGSLRPGSTFTTGVVGGTVLTAPGEPWLVTGTPVAGVVGVGVNATASGAVVVAAALAFPAAVIAATISFNPAAMEPVWVVKSV